MCSSKKRSGMQRAEAWQERKEKLRSRGCAGRSSDGRRRTSKSSCRKECSNSRRRSCRKWLDLRVPGGQWRRRLRTLLQGFGPCRTKNEDEGTGREVRIESPRDPLPQEQSRKQPFTVRYVTMWLVGWLMFALDWGRHCWQKFSRGKAKDGQSYRNKFRRVTRRWRRKGRRYLRKLGGLTKEALLTKRRKRGRQATKGDGSIGGELQGGTSAKGTVGAIEGQKRPLERAIRIKSGRPSGRQRKRAQTKRVACLGQPTQARERLPNSPRREERRKHEGCRRAVRVAMAVILSTSHQFRPLSFESSKKAGEEHRTCGGEVKGKEQAEKVKQGRSLVLEDRGGGSAYGTRQLLAGLKEQAAPRQNMARWSNVPGESVWELKWMEARALGGWRGTRVGEAKKPGPYTEGGATSSGEVWKLIGHGRWSKAEEQHEPVSPSASVTRECTTVEQKGIRDDVTRKAVGVTKERWQKKTGASNLDPARDKGGLDLQNKVGSTVDSHGKGEAEASLSEESRRRIDLNRAKAMERRQARQGRDQVAGSLDSNACEEEARLEEAGAADIQRGSHEGEASGLRISPENLFRQLQEQTERERRNESRRWEGLRHLTARSGAKKPGGEAGGHAVSDGMEGRATRSADIGGRSDESGTLSDDLWGVLQQKRSPQLGGDYPPPVEYDQAEQSEDGTNEAEVTQTRTISQKELARASEASWAAPGWGRRAERKRAGPNAGKGRGVNQEGAHGPGTVTEQLRAVAGQRTAQARPRGRRGRRGTEVEHHFITMNTSGRPQLLENLDRLNARGTRTCAVLNQEHHQWHRDLGELQYMASASGWKTGAVPAVAGPKGGASAGTAIFVRKAIGFDRATKGWSGGSGVAEGRIAVAWSQAVTKAGILILSVYLWTNEGLSAKNLRVLAAAAAIIDSHGGPWLIGGDFNMTPEELQQGAGWEWLGRVGGVVRGTGTPTCAGGVGRELDFFIIDARLAEQVIKVEPVLSLRKEPHSPVRMVLKATRANLLMKVVKRPGMFPITKPIGCCRMPVVPPQLEWSDMVQKVNTGELVNEGEKKDVVNRLWTLVSACTEAELCGCCDAVDSEGLSAGKFMGRATGVAYKQAQVWPKRASGKLGTTDLVNHGLAWMASRLSELHQLTLSARRAAQNNEAWRLASERQWTNLVARFKPSSALLRAVMTKVPEAEDCLRVVGALDPRQRESPEILAHWAQWADTTARERKRQGLSSRRDGWGKWVELQLKKGAGALFKHAKREEVNQGASVTKDGVKTGAPQDVVDAEREEWINTWHKFVDIAQAPWRTETIDAAPLPRPTIEEARHCIASFKPYTAVGVCSTRPRWYGWLSDALISAWIDFFVVIEEVGRWPDDIQDILIHLIPKPSSGTRPIGVLPSPLRWWEKLRKATIWRWRAQNERDYNWSTRGRSAEAAVYGQALRDEAALARGHCVAATLFDLTKAYETVRLELVWEAGKKFGFPLRVLRIALEGFAFARHLIFNRAVAQPVLTLSAILAGAGAAQDALLLVLMGPVDELVAMSQAMTSFILYVDDLGAHTRGGSEQAVADQSCRVADLTIQILEEGLGLTLSRGREGFASSEAKTVGVGSGRGLRTMLLKRLGKRGIHVRKEAKHLGVDYGPGSKRGVKAAQTKRVQAAKRQFTRIKRLGSFGGARIFRGGPMQGMKYGATVQGVSAATLAAARRMAAEVYGKSHGRSCTARLQIYGYDPAEDLIVPAVMEWACAAWEKRLPARDMAMAWRRAKEEMSQTHLQHAKVSGPGGAFLSALSRLGWSPQSPFTVMDQLGRTFDLRNTAPRTIKELAKDAWYDRKAVESEVYADIFDEEGSRGYGRGRVMVDGKALTLEQSGRDEVKRWAEAKCHRLEGAYVPWFEPLQGLIKTAIRKRRMTAPWRSIIAMAEGGWWTQLRRFKSGMARDPWCRACGPWKQAGRGNSQEPTIEEIMYLDWQAERALGLPNLEEDLVHDLVDMWEGPQANDSIGEERSSQRTLRQPDGARVACLFHRALGCDRGETGKTDEAKKVKEALIHEANAEPYNPLFTRGVPLLPRIGEPPGYAERLGPGDKGEAGLMAQGVAYSDGACRGLFRRTKRAGWGFLVRASATSESWSMYGPCPDVCPSAVRAELWAILSILRRAVPKLTIFTDNAEVVRGFANGAIFACRATRIGADLWRMIWEISTDLEAANQGRLIEDLIAVKKVKAHLRLEDVAKGRISQDHLEGNAAADWLAKQGAKWAQTLSPNDEADRAFQTAIKFYRWLAEWARDWPNDTDAGVYSEQGDAPERARRPRRERGPWGAAVHALWPHELWGFNGGLWRCRRCSRSTQSISNPKAFAREKCRGSLAGRAQVAAGESAEEAFSSFNHTMEEFIGRGGKRGSAEDTGPTGASCGSVWEAVRRKWTEAKSRREAIQTPDRHRDETTGERRPGPLAGGVPAMPTSIIEDHSPPLTRKRLLGELRARVCQRAEAGRAEPEEHGSEEGMRPRRPTAEEALQRRLQPIGGDRAWRRQVVDGACVPQIKRGRVTTSEEQITGALLGLTRAATKAVALHEAQAAPRPKKGGEGQASSREQLRDDDPAPVEDCRIERLEIEQVELADGGGDRRPAPSSEPAASSDDLQEGSEAAATTRERLSSRSPRGRRPPAVTNELGHRLQRTGTLVWCDRCGGHAGGRVGKLLKQKCRPVQRDEGGARPTRLKRLLERKHPVSGVRLEL